MLLGKCGRINGGGKNTKQCGEERGWKFLWNDRIASMDRFIFLAGMGASGEQDLRTGPDSGLARMDTLLFPQSVC
jgi:hypothetical protein